MVNIRQEIDGNFRSPILKKDVLKYINFYFFTNACHGEVIPELGLRFNTDCSRTRSNGSLKRSGHNQKQPSSNLKRFAAVIFQFLADYCTLSFPKVYGAILADFINTLMIMNPLHLQGTHEYLRKVEYDRTWWESYS